MSKRPEVRNVQTPGGSETAAEYFSTIQYSKKSLLQENSRSRLLADSSSKCLKQPFSGICAQRIQQSVHSSYSLSFTTPALPGS